MGSHGPKTSRPTKPPSQSSAPPRSSSSSLSSHLAMVELKQRILNSLSKLADRDTSQIAVEELEGTIQSLQNDAVSMFLNSLFDASTCDPKPAVRKESIRLLAVLCGSRPDSTSTHLVKINAHIAKKLRDTDSGVRDACREAFGSLSGIYLQGEGENGVFSLFMRPLFEAMGENNKAVQVGAAMCLGRVVGCAKNPPVSAFQKLPPRICKYLNSPNYFAKSALLSVVATLSQAGVILPQNLDPLLQCIHECLVSADWATRKAAADTLIALALYSSDLIKDGAASTLTVLEASRFDKIKPVRDSITEALQLWKKITGKTENGSADEQKASGAENPGSGEFPLRNMKGAAHPNTSGIDSSQKDSFNASSTADSFDRIKDGSISDKNVGILKKKVPALTDKELNPQFFQKLDKRGSDDVSVEVVVSQSRKVLPPLNSLEQEQDQESSGSQIKAVKLPSDGNSKQQNTETSAHDRLVEGRMNMKDWRGRGGDIDDGSFGFSETDGQPEGSFSKENWLAIRRQLLQLERQQAHLMNMLQDFMGGSHDSMITLENRVRGLERVVEEMAQDLSISSGRRAGNFLSGFEGSSTQSSSRYSGFFDYGSKMGRNGDGRLPFGNRFTTSDGTAASGRGRGPSWRSEVPDSWDFHSYGAPKAAQLSARRDVGSNHMDGRSPKSEHENDPGSGRRAWDKAVGLIRFGEGPSARSVWQASKDEATLQAIRVAGEDGGTVRTARVPIPEMTAEAMGNGISEQEQDPIRTSWSNAMDAFQVGDMDTAYAEVLSTGDDFLLVKLMDRSGPVLDQLSNEIAVELLNAITPLLMEQNLFDLCLYWAQQLIDIVMENGPDVFGIPMDVKREFLFNLHEASSTIELPDDWDGAAPEQLMLQLASAWGIDLQQHGS